MTSLQRRFILVIWACHFIAAFAALGMPPFFALILSESLHSDEIYLAGWLYIVPTLFAALTSPWWGSFADRVSKKISLLRAQLGLSISFLLAGYATEPWLFFFALVLQGVLGGTFAASNAYLATIVSGPALTRSLTIMQASARAALVIAPVLLGLAIALLDSPVEIYRYLAALPLLAAVILWRYPHPDTGDAGATAATASHSAATAERVAPQALLGLEFAFVFATVITLPYFISYAQQAFTSLSLAGASLLFGLPHLVYLLCAAPLSRYLGQRRLVECLAMGLLLLAVSLVAQAQTLSLTALIVWRIIMGTAMTACFIVLHGLVANLVHSANAGRVFGWYESVSKLGAVTAGVAAGIAAQAHGPQSPFLLGAVTLIVAVGGLVGLKLYRLRAKTV